MAQEFNVENFKAVKRVYESLKDGAFSKLESSMATVTEQAKASGVTKLIQSCEAASQEGVPAILKCFENLTEVLEQYIKDNQSIYAALGVDE